MDTLGLVVHDEETFLSRVVNEGTAEGVFTRDRADEIIRISIAMANKYVLQKEVDFRSTEELANVQQTILKLIGIGLEMKTKGSVEEGIRVLMETSPVELFRLAYTRIEKLRHRWKLLLLNHRLEILVSREEYESLSDLACHRLAEMSIFTESELHTIQAMKLDDQLFSSLGLVEYYELELERYQFILALKEILPFELLNKSRKVRAEFLSEVDSLREAFINTLIVTGCAESPDTVTVAMEDVRGFLSALNLEESDDLIPDRLENVLLDIIQELGEGLDEGQAALLTKEIIGTAQKLLDTIIREKDTVTSPHEAVFFERWSRLLILSDGPDLVKRVLSGDGMLDEYEFEMLVDRLLSLSETEAQRIVTKLPWRRMVPNQIVRLFHQVAAHHVLMAKKVSLTGFSAMDLVELLEGLEPHVQSALLPSVERVLGQARYTLEELELLARLPLSETSALLRAAGSPVNMELRQILLEFRDGSERIRQVLFSSCVGSEIFPEVLAEAWSIDPVFVKRQLKELPAPQIGPFFASASPNEQPSVVTSKKNEPELDFQSKMLNALFKSLSKGKKQSAVKYFTKDR